jgi:hypothetical protein
MNDELTPGIIRQWKPVDHAELLACWRSLLPELQEPLPPPGAQARRFLGRDLTPQQAGWVFETLGLRIVPARPNVPFG